MRLHHVLLLTAGVLTSTAHAAELTNVSPPEFGTRFIADTAYSAEHEAPNVADGVVERGHGWFSRDSTELPCRLTAAFSREMAVHAVVLHQAVWTDSMYHCKDVAVEVSTDGTQWREVARGTMEDTSGAALRLSLQAPTPCTALRVVVLTSYIQPQTCGFAEVEILAEGIPVLRAPEFLVDGERTGPSSSVFGLSLIAGSGGSQMATMTSPASAVVSLVAGGSAGICWPFAGSIDDAATVVAVVEHLDGGNAQITAALGDDVQPKALAPHERIELRAEAPAPEALTLSIAAPDGAASVRISGLDVRMAGEPLMAPMPDVPPWTEAGPPPITPPLHPAIERTFIEWDWRLQDGIGTARRPTAWRDAIARMIETGDPLAADLAGAGLPAETLADWADVANEWGGVRQLADAPDATLEDLWRRAHWAKRDLSFANPLAQLPPVLFIKRVPAAFSHQLTQYYGRYARPGGGVFLLESPGDSMAIRELTADLPDGGYQHLNLAYDASRAFFAFCEAETAPENGVQGHHGRYYHLYEVSPDGGGLRALTDGPFDDFSPCELPDGRIVFISTRRNGWHRCGTPGCENYTLAAMGPDGADPRPISLHETQEWDPAVLHDGRVVYTRWDYVDRHAVFYEQLWWTLPNGGQPSALYGNNTFNPVGVWEPRPVPGSRAIMATAAAHHAMTAGSIILVDPARGVDGLAPIRRLTPDVPFPESETPLAPHWRADIPGLAAVVTEQSERWPGHCYRTPHPLSEDYFLAAYSFAGLIGEPQGNPANMFGLYLVDRFGNKELLYRDPNISSLWPVPVRPTPRPPQVLASVDDGLDGVGAYFVQDIRVSDPALPDERVAALRILQVLPKSTPGANNPTVGLANASPGKQVLGTVPVEADGSAYFRAPARIPLAFQALDERGRALQIMRSVVYLQPGETVSCVGCHESRASAPPNTASIAASRSPSDITPGPDGSRPLSYPILVQPVLDRACVSCHTGDAPSAGIRLTGEPDGRYTGSYNALAPLVAYTDWRGGDFRADNSEPLAMPLRFGARGSRLTGILETDRCGARLTADDWDRLTTWMDANGLFYGTFDFDDQQRQLLGQRIDGPALE